MTSHVGHHLPGRAAHFAVQAEDRDLVDRIDIILGLDHIVLLVAAQAVLRPERRGQLDVAKRGERVEAVRQVARHRRGMGQQRDALAGERRAKRGVGKQPFDAEFH